MKDEIIIYQPDKRSTRIEVRIEEDTVWLTQAQMAELFRSTKQNVSLHINNIYKEKELSYDSTVKEYLTVQKEGIRKVKRKLTIYNIGASIKDMGKKWFAFSKIELDPLEITNPNYAIN